MKIGFSFGRCVRDIVLGKVKEDEVMCIIARTFMKTDEDIGFVIEEYGYHPSYLRGLDIDKCKEVAIRLFHNGRIHQPRTFGSSRYAVPEGFVWMDLAPTPTDTSEATLEAWNNYRMMIRLCDDEVDDVSNAPRN